MQHKASNLLQDSRVLLVVDEASHQVLGAVRMAKARKKQRACFGWIQARYCVAKLDYPMFLDCRAFVAEKKLVASRLER